MRDLEATVGCAPFGRHVAVISLTGPCRGPEAGENLVRAVAQAVEADRTGLVVDARDATGLGADVLSALVDIDRAAAQADWRVALVRPDRGPLRVLFREIELDLTMPVFTTRATAILWTMASRRYGARSLRVVLEAIG
jgi:hypothetical protein